jgi:predicted PP-loop superfamily ATPase
MKNYQFFRSVPRGTGDYGSDCVFIGELELKKIQAEKTADALSKELDASITVFSGRKFGKFVYESKPGTSILADRIRTITDTRMRLIKHAACFMRVGDIERAEATLELARQLQERIAKLKWRNYAR